MFNAVPTTDWGSPETLEHWRQTWAELCNAKFAEKGLDVRIDHRSYDRILQSGMTTKDFIAPTSFLFKSSKDFMMGDTYYPLVEALGGQVIHISSTSKDYINPMDINLNYADDDNPLGMKSDFILSLCELIMGARDGMEPEEKSVIDRCLPLVYQKYLNDPKPENMPTLGDLYDCLREQKERQAQRIATALEIYVNGSLRVFNHQTNAGDGEEDAPRHHSTAKQSADYYKAHQEEGKPKDAPAESDAEPPTKKGRLSFEDEKGGIVRGMGMGVKKVAKKGVDTATGFAHQKVHQVEKDNSGVEAAHKSEEAAERLHHFVKGRKKPKDKSARAEKRGGEDQKSSRLKFTESEGGTAENAAEPPLKKKQPQPPPTAAGGESKTVGAKFYQKKQYKDAYAAAKRGQKAGTAASNSALTASAPRVKITSVRTAIRTRFSTGRRLCNAACRRASHRDVSG